MKISIDRVDSIAIRNEMSKDHYSTAEILGTYAHKDHPDNADWTVRLYRAADTLVFSTNGDAIWNGTAEFDALCEEYGVDISTL